jgi:hypothetical protein
VALRSIPEPVKQETTK